MLNTETPTTEALRLARYYGDRALELVRDPAHWPLADRSRCTICESNRFHLTWSARLAARHAAAYLALTRQDPPNVRFTVFSLSAERCALTLKPGQTLTTRRFVQHSEGWSRDETAWTYVTDDGPPHVRVTHFSDGTDCDGRMTDCQEAICPIDRLTSTTNYYGDRVPDWTPADRYHRDYAAEAAGY